MNNNENVIDQFIDFNGISTLVILCQEVGELYSYRIQMICKQI